MIFAYLFMFLFNAYSQQLKFQKPDYELIKTEIQDTSSIYYYSKLMSRFMALDMTLNLSDFRHLYYGYIYQKEYQPYWKSQDEDKLLAFFQNENLNQKDYDEIIKIATHSIKEFPFDLRPMYLMAYIYHLKGDEEMNKKVSYRFQGLFQTIMSSGDGKSCETGFHVISVSHEYVILKMSQLQFKKQFLIGDCDYLEVEKNERNIDGFYFNIKKLFEKNLENIEQKYKATQNK